VAVHLHRAVRTAELADALGGLLAEALEDPFLEEVIVVPEHGVERWLAQRLSNRLGAPDSGGGGVCAGVRFVRPASLVTMLTGREHDDPWLAAHLAWHLLAVIDASLGEPWCAALTRHLGADGGEDPDDVRAGRRYSVALRLARLVQRYGEQRPAVLTAWREGRDEDGTGAPLALDLRWQAELYRRLIASVSEPPPDVRHATTLDRLRAGDPTLDLPARLSLFGHTRLARTEMDLLRALGAHREVHLWLPQPSPAAWDAVRPLGGIVSREEDDARLLIEHPLLASLGRDSRELARVVGPDGVLDEGHVAAPVAAPTTVLGWLQADLSANHRPSLADREGRVPAPADRSLSVHACHGPSRQVDVLREVLVGLLEDDPTLEPRDVLIMCPDVEVYAPLIGAAFGLGDHGTDADGVDAHPAHRLRVSVADRAARATNPLLAVAERLLGLVGGRATASEVLDLLAAAPVRARFRLTDDNLETLTGWAASAGVRWGLDATGRTPFALGHEEQNTWRFGLDRLLAGVAVSADGPLSVGLTLPLDDVGSGSIDLVGRLAEALDRLGSGVADLAVASCAREWTTALREAVLNLTDVARTDAWQVGDLDRTLEEATRLSTDVPLLVDDVRVLLSDRLAGRPGRASFRTGALTVCTMVPMRSVPHRVICLVGLDDDSFPRQPGVDGDDVLARRPLTGERDPRSEDRQLLLDAVLAAGEHLVVTYTGADERSGERRPPAVPLVELIDAAGESVSPAADESVLAVTQHPLQPFDSRNFVAEAASAAGGRVFSFDRAALAGARAAIGVRRPDVRGIVASLPVHLAEDVSLSDLVAFCENPARTFLRDRLGVAISWEDEEIHDRMPVAPDPLELWTIGDRGLHARRAGRPAADVWRAELLRGDLPPGSLAQHTLRPVATRVEDLVTWVERRTRGAGASTVDVVVPLPGGRRLTGAIDGVHGATVLSATYSRVGAKHELGAWVRLLALTVSAAPPDAAGWTATVAGTSNRGVSGALLGPLESDLAHTLLLDLVALLDLGTSAPLPLPAKTGREWARTLHGAGDLTSATHRTLAEGRAAQEWIGGAFPGERADRWWQRVHPDAPFEHLLRPVAGDGTGLADLAPRLWTPLLDHRRDLS